MLVPKGKTFCFGSRKFVEGDILPPFIRGVSFGDSDPETYIETIPDEPSKPIKSGLDIVNDNFEKPKMKRGPYKSRKKKQELY